MRIWSSDPGADIEAELAFHLEMKRRRLRERGVSDEEAGWHAQAAFGNVEAIRKELHTMHRRHAVRRRLRRWVEDLRLDGRIGLRALLRRPAFALAVVLTLALGVGAATAIFAVVRGVLLQPLPYADPDRLIVLWEQDIVRDIRGNVVAVSNYEAWRDGNRSFDQLTALIPSRMTLRSDIPERLSGAEVSPAWFSLLGWQPAQGRAFTETDVRAGDPVVVLSHGLWQRRFGSDPRIVGQSIFLNERPHLVLGIMPAGFEPPEIGWLGTQEYWLPFWPNDENRGWGRAMIVLGRLRDGVTFDQARSEMTALSERLAREIERNRNWRAELKPLHDQITGSVRPAVLILFGATLLLFLIALVNVANLTLARAQERRAEFAVRGALGAGRSRVLRQLLAEQAILMLIVLPVALAIAYWSLRALQVFFPPDLPRAQAVRLDGQVLVFATVAALVALLVVGSAPILTASRSRLQHWLRHASGRVRTGSRSGLVIASETALALLLAVSAGLVVRSFMAVRAVDLGFNAEDIVVFRVSLPGATYTDGAQRTQFFAGLLERLRALPDVSEAGQVSVRPLGGISVATGVLPANGAAPETRPVVDIRNADRDYFRTVDIRLLAGRNFDDRDVEGRPRVALINRTLARILWPDRSAVGQHANVLLNGGMDAEIIGVVDDVRLAGPDSEPRGTLYFAAAQSAPATVDIVVHSSTPFESMVPRLRSLVRELDAALPIFQVDRYQELVDRQTSQQRLSTVLLSAFALIALVLVVGGIYAVVALDAARRKRDFGVRLALGASPAQLRRLMLRGTLRHAGTGILIGAALAWVLTRYLQALLFNVQPNDPLTITSAALLLLLTAMAAAILPAVRAARQDPAASLRE